MGLKSPDKVTTQTAHGDKQNHVVSTGQLLQATDAQSLSPGLAWTRGDPALGILPLKSSHHLREGLFDGKKNKMMTMATPVTASEMNLQ